MIFSDQKTADQYRKIATEELAYFIYDLSLEANRVKYEIEPETLLQLIRDKIKFDLPQHVALLLYRSGIISGGQDYDPIVTFYDKDHNGKVAEAMASIPGHLIGGVVNGRIHT